MLYNAALSYMMEHCPRSVLILHRHTESSILGPEWTDPCQRSERCLIEGTGMCVGEEQKVFKCGKEMEQAEKEQDGVKSEKVE